MSQNPGIPLNAGTEQSVTACSNCHSPMPAGLRFCRNCGFRLGEGSAEYTDTVRFQNGHNAVAAAGRPTAGQQSLVTSYGLGNAPAATTTGCFMKRGRKMSGMTWIFLALLSFFLVAGVFTAVFSPRRNFSNVGVIAISPPRSYVGVNGFDTVDGGVTFGNVEPPGSPADKAGLIGGDIITTFDGHTIDDSDDMSDLLKDTPIGKTVEVVYIRDGVTNTTKLTTMSKDEFDRLAADFRKRPEGRGKFGYDSGDVERVQVPNSNIYGVRLDNVTPNNPADLAGIKKGDIIVSFDSVPIRTGAELVSRVYRALPYSTVVVTVIRDGEKIDIPVKMGRQ